MDGKKDFTVDEKAFPGLPGFSENLHKQGLKYVIIMVCWNTYLVV